MKTMIPFFQNDAISAYQGNTLTILPLLHSGSVDAIITDPPYSSGAAMLSVKQADPAQKYQGTGTKKTYPPMPGDAKDQRSFTWWMTQGSASVGALPATALLSLSLRTGDSFRA